MHTFLLRSCLAAVGGSVLFFACATSDEGVFPSGISGSPHIKDAASEFSSSGGFPNHDSGNGGSVFGGTAGTGFGGTETGGTGGGLFGGGGSSVGGSGGSGAVGGTPSGGGGGSVGGSGGIPPSGGGTGGIPPGGGGSGNVGGGGGSGGTAGGTGNCCTAHTTPTCSVPSISSCVCAIDPFCCATAWDSICVGEVTSGGCGNCGGTSVGNCCTAHLTPSCSNSSIANCVCASDPYCCSTEWDSICAGEVNSLGCGTC